jgi:hypothetical protein
MSRDRLGTPRTTRRLSGGVNIDAIPFLKGEYAVLPAVGENAIIGDAPKNYVVFPTRVPGARAFIARSPRVEGPIECVTEYLISCIGTLLPLRVAEGSLVRLPSRFGAEPDVRFMSRLFVSKEAGDVLVHGVELVARCFGVDEDQVWKEVPPRVAAATDRPRRIGRRRSIHRGNPAPGKMGRSWASQDALHPLRTASERSCCAAATGELRSRGHFRARSGS